jgi:hypothetical protein
VVDLIEEAARLQDFLVARGFRYCFIGGIAVQHWGEPRLTRDIDVAVISGFGNEAAIADALLAAYPARIAEARDFAIARRVVLLRSPGGIGLDVALAALPFEEGMTERAVLVEVIPGRKLRLCSAEDLIVMKVFAGRATDLRDARSVIVRQGDSKLDWPYVERHLADFAELQGDRRCLSDLANIRRRPDERP